MLNVPDDMLVERVVGRRIDPETGNSYHVKFNPVPEELVDKVIQRADDTEEKVKVRTSIYLCANACGFVSGVFNTNMGL
jgi:adenylate kinase